MMKSKKKIVKAKKIIITKIRIKSNREKMEWKIIKKINSKKYLIFHK